MRRTRVIVPQGHVSRFARCRGEAHADDLCLHVARAVRFEGVCNRRRPLEFFQPRCEVLR